MAPWNWTGEYGRCGKGGAGTCGGWARLVLGGGPGTRPTGRPAGVVGRFHRDQGEPAADAAEREP